MNGNGIDSSAQGRAAYEAPRVERLGFFHVETQNGCLFGKQWADPTRGQASSA